MASWGEIIKEERQEQPERLNEYARVYGEDLSMFIYRFVPFFLAASCYHS